MIKSFVEENVLPFIFLRNLILLCDLQPFYRTLLELFTTFYLFHKSHFHQFPAVSARKNEN